MKKAATREFIRTVRIDSPILGAFTVAKKADVIEKRTLFIHDEGLADSFAGIVIETLAQATILEMSKFKQFHADRPVCICSEYTSEKVEPKATKAILVKCPWRSSKYPRDFHEADWIEPFVNDAGEQKRNPDWESAMWEMMIYIDPSQAFYDTVPVELYRHDNGFAFQISGDFLLLDDAVDCVPVKLHE